MLTLNFPKFIDQSIEHWNSKRCYCYCTCCSSDVAFDSWEVFDLRTCHCADRGWLPCFGSDRCYKPCKECDHLTENSHQCFRHLMPMRCHSPSLLKKHLANIKKKKIRKKSNYFTFIAVYMEALFHCHNSNCFLISGFRYDW